MGSNFFVEYLHDSLNETTFVNIEIIIYSESIIFISIYVCMYVEKLAFGYFNMFGWNFMNNKKYIRKNNN